MQEKADADAAAAEGTSQMWVAQKYIEQPLIINRRYLTLPYLIPTVPGPYLGLAPLLLLFKCQLLHGVRSVLLVQHHVQACVVACRKFDIRQWVLVTSSAPMTAWFYQECYLRFCAEDYSLSDLTNVFSHLSNNCIARKSLHFESGWSCARATGLLA